MQVGRIARRFLSRARLLLAALVAGCASEPPIPYPAFIQTAELPDVFIAGLPGVRAKQLAGNPESRRSSTVLSLPGGWEFTTGGFPDKSVELFVIAGTLKLGDIEMKQGGYAYLPSGDSGVPVSTQTGAEVLYFLDDRKDDAVIQTPMIVDASLLAWESGDEVDTFGLAVKVLREDPGSGAKTWLQRVQPGASRAWQRSASPTEGLLLSGNDRYAECVGGVPVTGDYLPGGYFLRPVGTVHGGPEAAAQATSVWYVRRWTGGEEQQASGCSASVSP